MPKKPSRLSRSERAALADTILDLDELADVPTQCKEQPSWFAKRPRKRADFLARDAFENALQTSSDRWYKTLTNLNAPTDSWWRYLNRQAFTDAIARRFRPPTASEEPPDRVRCMPPGRAENLRIRPEQPSLSTTRARHGWAARRASRIEARLIARLDRVDPRDPATWDEDERRAQLDRFCREWPMHARGVQGLLAKHGEIGALARTWGVTRQTVHGWKRAAKNAFAEWLKKRP